MPNLPPKLSDDPYLAPYRGVMAARTTLARKRACALCGDASRLADVAEEHVRLGLHRTPSGSWIFRERAPNATAVWLVGDFSQWRVQEKFRLKRKRRSGLWEGHFPPTALAHGMFYRLEMTWPGGGGERIPSCARRVVQDARTHLFAAQVWDAPPYVWRHAAPTRQKDEPLFIYEAHVGMAGEEPGVATYAHFRERIIPRIRAAGYNAVQLMAIMEHPYYGSFGYHVSSFFAPSSRFGTPEELKALVDTAHAAGLLVIMDLVHSHAVRNERDGLSRFDGTETQFFHAGKRGYHEAWDSRCFDYAKPEVLRFLLSNCRYWLEEFHFDGFRFDGVTSMLYRHHGLGRAFTNYGMYFDDAVDADAWAYLALANRVIHEVNPAAITIAEDVSGMPGCAAPFAEGGLGFDYRMAMGIPDWWFKTADQPDESWSMGGLFWALADRRAEERTVSYVESHDQSLVGGKTFFFRLADAALYTGMRKQDQCPAVDRAMALHKMARLATAALNGGAYLTFMGNEFGHPEWVDFPREGNGWSYAHARRQWSLRDDPTLRFGGLAAFDAALVSCVRNLVGAPVLLRADEGAKVLAFMRGDLLFAFNFHPTASYADCAVCVPSGTYRLVLDTDRFAFGGFERIAAAQVMHPLPQRVGNEQINFLHLYLPVRTALVLKREK